MNFKGLPRLGVNVFTVDIALLDEQGWIIQFGNGMHGCDETESRSVHWDLVWESRTRRGENATEERHDEGKVRNVGFIP